MRELFRVMGLTALSIVATVLVVLSSTTSSLYALTAATYMLPGSFGAPFTDRVKAEWTDFYVGATTGTQPPPPLSVRFWPAMPDSPGTIGTGSVVFGYSLGAYAAGVYKDDFNRYWAARPEEAPEITFVVIGNTRRPNGGLSTRWGAAGTPTVTEGAEAGDITTYDVARQYDPAADFPTNPFNLLAYANASAALWTVHTDYGGVDWDEAVSQGTYGDTEYFLIPTYPLPLLAGLNSIPAIGPMLADSIDPVLRVLVEAAYDRTGNPGERTPFNVFYSPDPVTLVRNLQEAMKVGQDNWSENLGLGRRLGTQRPGPYGVGGPPVEVEAPAPADHTPGSIRSASTANSDELPGRSGHTGTEPTAAALPDDDAPSASVAPVTMPARDRTPSDTALTAPPMAPTAHDGGGDSAIRRGNDWKHSESNPGHMSVKRLIDKAVRDLRTALTPQAPSTEPDNEERETDPPEKDSPPDEPAADDDREPTKDQTAS